MALNVCTCSIVPDPSCTAVTIVKVKHLFLTGFNVCDFFVDVVWVRGWSFDEEGTRINEATVSSSSMCDTSSIVDAVRIASSNGVLL